MGATASAFAAFFTPVAEAGAADAAMVATTAGAADTTLAATAAASATAASALNPLLVSAGKQAGTAALTAGVGKLLTPSPKPPSVKPELAMPDPLEQQKARQRTIAETLAGRGRAGTILTDTSAKLGS
jgi:hypothetical protein